MRGFELDLRGHPSIASFLPTTGTNAPAVAGFESGKLIFWARGDEVVPTQEGKLKEFRSHDRAHGVNPHISMAGMAKSIPKKSRQR